MQRFSNRRGDKQLHQQEVADVAIQKFVSAGLIPPPPPQHQQQHQPKQPQRRQGGLNPEEREQYLSSRPVSPLIAPSVKARPSSVAEKGNLKIGGRSSNTANNNTQPDSFENNVVNDTRPQSPISFLDSPGPLIQAQEQATGSIETVTSPSSTNQAVAAVSATAAATALVRKGSHSPFHVTLTTSRSVSSINTATPGPSPDNLETYSAFNHQENQHLHISDKSPTDRADKKKRNWFSWGSKESSNTIEQKQSKALHQQEQQQLQQLQQPISKPKSNSHRGHLPRHPFTTAPKVLQKKKRPVGTKESTQIHQHPLPTNNSPEPSFSSKFTDEEQDLNEDYSEVPKNTIDNTTTRERQSQLTLADQQGESPSQPSLDYRDPDSERSLKTASSHSHQPEIGGLQKPAPSWESRLRQGSTNHQRAASTDERNTVQSAGASAQTNRAELKYRDDRLVPTSRPSSRQSIDPPSPSESGFNQLIHSRTNSSQNKNNQAKGYMGGSTNQQHFLGRNGEPQNNSGNREGSFVTSRWKILC